MKNKKNSGFSEMIFGFVFLFNPCVHIIDILPDIFGMLLILDGMKKLADLDTHLSEARAGIKRAMWVSLGKAVAMVLALNVNFLDTYMMFIFAFAGGILECIFLIPAFRHLFTGTEYLRLRLADRSNEASSSNAAAVSVVFIIARNVLAAVPVFTPGADNEYGDVVSGGKQVDTATIRTVLTLLCLTLSLIIGIVWLSSMIKYFRELSRDKEFCAAAENEYTERILSDEALWTRRRVRNFSVLYPLAFLLLLCLKFDSYYVIPEFLFGAVILIALFRAGRFAPEIKKSVVALCVSQIAVSACAYILMIYYSGFYGRLLYPYTEKGFFEVFAVYGVFFTASMALVLLICRKMRAIQYKMTDVCVGWGDEFQGREEIDEARRKEIKKKINATYILQTVYCAVSLACMAAIPFENVSDVFAITWAVRSLLSAVVMISIYAASGEIISEAEK